MHFRAEAASIATDVLRLGLAVGHRLELFAQAMRLRSKFACPSLGVDEFVNRSRFNKPGSRERSLRNRYPATPACFFQEWHCVRRVKLAAYPVAE
jgi:hypothetical protein